MEPDGKPGNYYVTVREGKRYGLLLGPFEQRRPGTLAHRQALGLVAWVTHYVSANWSQSCWWAFGTARLPLDLAPPRGKLNEILTPWREER